jgi:hypothetical protein
VAIPGLSKLRELAGQAAYETGPVDVIRNMLRRGELPTGTRCAISGVETKDVVELYVEAERVHPGFDHLNYAWLLGLISPILLVGLFQKPRPDLGRETIVDTPLRVAAAYHRRVRRSGQRALKKWLRSEPFYAELLDAYPAATVGVRTQPTATSVEGKALDGMWLEWNSDHDRPLTLP